jgi:hypothetical protein
MEESGQLHVVAPLPQKKMPKQGGPQCWSGRFRENNTPLPLVGI